MTLMVPYVGVPGEAEDGERLAKGPYRKNGTQDAGAASPATGEILPGIPAHRVIPIQHRCL
jgi:hypothetical protein